MKHLFLSLLAVGCLWSCNNNKEKKNDLQEKGLKGNVKSVKTEKFEAIEQFGKIVTGDIYPFTFLDDNSFLLFNNKGNLIEKETYDWGTLSRKISYKYDDKENLILIDLDIYNSLGVLYHKHIHQFKYNNKGNITEEKWYNYEIEESTPHYKYDDKDLQHQIIYQYNDKNLPTEENYYNSDQKQFKKINKIYDDIGNVIEKKDYSFGLDSVSKGVMNIYRYKYNNEGNKIEENTYDSEEKLTSKHTYKYDDNGNEIEWNDYDSEGKLKDKETYQYTYDSQGNWIEKIEYIDDKPQYITKRTIEYY